jgi:hypothetical protein
MSPGAEPPQAGRSPGGTRGPFVALGAGAVHRDLGAMNRTARLVAAGVLACSAGVAAAAGWSIQLADGRQVSIVADSAAGEGAQFLERRLPDGTLDRQFGSAGRVVFSLGADSPGPRSVRADSNGRLLVVGAAMGLQSRAVPASLRFLPDGKIDLSWGAQGRSLVPSPGTDAAGIDLLPLPDGTVLMLGQIESSSAEQAALWLLGSNGVVDSGFGQGGVMRASALEMSEGLALQLDDDGAALVAVMTAHQGVGWLEVHRWQAGGGLPLRVARQPMPADWQGPPTLARRGGAWQWFDASQPVTNGGVPLVAVAAASAWSNAAMATTANSAAVQANASEGGAAWNPFSNPASVGTAAAAAETESFEPPWVGLAVTAFAALAGLGWWRLRRTEVAMPSGSKRSGSGLAPLARAKSPARHKDAARSGMGRGPAFRWRERPVQARKVHAEPGSPPAAPPAAEAAAAAPASAAHDTRGMNAHGALPGRRPFVKQVRDLGALELQAPPGERTWVLNRRQNGRFETLACSPPGLRALGWLRLLRQIDRDNSAANSLHVVCERRAALMHPVVRAWLGRHPHFHVHMAAGQAARPRGLALALRRAGMPAQSTLRSPLG